MSRRIKSAADIEASTRDNAEFLLFCLDKMALCVHNWVANDISGMVVIVIIIIKVKR